MADDDLLTFEQLKTIQNKEQGQDTLQELDDGFFDRVKDYLNRKQRIGGHLNNKEYRNAKHIVQDILDSRQKKIIRLAFLSTKSSLSVDNLLPEEEVLFDKVRESITEHRSDIEDQLFDEDGETNTSSTGDIPEKDTDDGKDEDEQDDGTDKADADESPQEGTEEEAKEPDSVGESPDTAGEDDAEDTTAGDEDDEELLFGGSDGADDEPDDRTAGAIEDSDDTDDTTAEPDGTADGEDDEMVEVRMTADVSEFMGVDLESYGPFDEGDTATIPDENAEVLQDQDKAEPLD